MIHSVDSYTTSVTGREHNLSNCVHKHSGKILDADMEVKATKQEAVQQPSVPKISMLDFVTINIKKLLGNGIGFFRGIWNESADEENAEEISGVVKGEELQQGHNKTEEVTVADLLAMETVADVKTVKPRENESEPERWKLSAAIPAIKVKIDQAKERFETGKDAFLKRMKEMAKGRKEQSFENKEERPGQQEKDMEWFEIRNKHLLDSYDKNGEYTNLGNRQEGKGYSGSPVKDNYSRKV